MLSLDQTVKSSFLFDHSKGQIEVHFQKISHTVKFLRVRIITFNEMKNLTHVEFDLIFTSVGIIKKLRQTEMNSTAITELVSSRANV